MGRKSTKQTKEIYISEAVYKFDKESNAVSYIPIHEDKQIVNWFVNLKLYKEYNLDAAESQTNRIRAQGWSSYKEKGDPQIYFNRDNTLHVWNIVEPLMTQLLKKAVDDEIDRREEKKRQESRLRSTLHIGPEYYNNRDYDPAPLSVLKECAELMMKDSAIKSETIDKKFNDFYRELIHSFSYDVNLSLVKEILAKLEPYKKIKEEETDE